MEEAKIAELLHEAAEAHHVVYRIVDGDDPDWASWYADWLLVSRNSPCCWAPRPQSSRPRTRARRREDAAAGDAEERWADAYARGLVERFRS